MKVGDIIANYGLEQDVAEYLSKVVESKDWGEYENHKKTLQKYCSNSEEYGRAIKCLIDIMGV